MNHTKVNSNKTTRGQSLGVANEVRKAVVSLLDRMPYIGRLRSDVRCLYKRLTLMRRQNGCYPAGHYYSPIPSLSEVEEQIERSQMVGEQLPGICFDHQLFRKLLDIFASYYRCLPYHLDAIDTECRYSFDQSFFRYADAIILFCMLKHLNPRRIIEIGSGFSSAVILDTLDTQGIHPAGVTMIEPHAERLKGILRQEDYKKINLVQQRVQDVDPSIFESLSENDLLFVDSSHVVKCGSDVQYIMFEILPRLSTGVVVHFHDVFFPFEYPKEWLLGGRYWNEAYFVRAFLSGNMAWKILWFNSFMGCAYRKELACLMPLCLRDTGGSVYIRKV